MSHSPAIGIDHNDISELAAMGQKMVGQLVRALVDLAVGENTLRRAWPLGLDNAGPVRVPFSVGSEDLMDGSTGYVST